MWFNSFIKCPDRVPCEEILIALSSEEASLLAPFIEDHSITWIKQWVKGCIVLLCGLGWRRAPFWQRSVWYYVFGCYILHYFPVCLTLRRTVHWEAGKLSWEDHPQKSKQWPFDILPLLHNLCPRTHNGFLKATTRRFHCLQHALTMPLRSASSLVLQLKAEWTQKETVSLTLEDVMSSNPLNHPTIYEPGERFPDVTQWSPERDFWGKGRKTVHCHLSVEAQTSSLSNVFNLVSIGLILYFFFYLPKENKDSIWSFYLV